jgi:glycerol transport system substrate-binding protein
MAPSPHGPYWEEGMKLGYQDCGSWTLMKSTPKERQQAAWLYAQFCICKSTSLKKLQVGLTPIRDSDIRSKAMDEMAPKLGGLVEFYRSPARVAWTPTGTNVPDYPRLAQLWWQNVAEAVTGEVTPQQAMDNLAKQQDQVLARLERAGNLGDCGPKLNEEKTAQEWFDAAGAPKPKLENEKEKGQTVAYDSLLQAWKEGKVR